MLAIFRERNVYKIERPYYVIYGSNMDYQLKYFRKLKNDFWPSQVLKKYISASIVAFVLQKGH